MKQAVICAAVLVMTASFALSQEGDPTGPNFTGDYVLIRSTGGLRGRAPKQLHIIQTERLFRVGTVDDHSHITWTKVPLRTDWVSDDGHGKVKAYFSYGTLNTERWIKLKDGYYTELDRWSFLGKATIKVCKKANARKSLWEEFEQSGCAEYARNQAPPHSGHCD